MPIMNTSAAKDARKNRYLTEYSSGIGFEPYQFFMGAGAFIVIALLSLVISMLLLPGLLIFGLALAAVAGYLFAIWPNTLNTRHKDPKKHIRDEVDKRMHHKLVINDQRVREPPAQHEVYNVEITQPPTEKYD
jgi:hypothetical protein